MVAKGEQSWQELRYFPKKERVTVLPSSTAARILMMNLWETQRKAVNISFHNNGSAA
jgi:hypothetical protein